ncbi:MAG: G5 domain-containing protein [Anaerolineae bacterium]|nr:G5 domain-containing protein [Anaerolineae bacterium]
MKRLPTPSGANSARARCRLLLLLCLLIVIYNSACTSAPPIAAPDRVVRLIADGDERMIQTQATTVRDLLNETGVVLDELDRVTPAETSLVLPSMTVTVLRVSQETEVITQTVPFGRQVVRDAGQQGGAALRVGESRLLQSGQPGVIERHYRITFEDGTEVDRALVREVLVQEPRDEIRLVGTRGAPENVPITGTLAYLSNQDAWLIRDSSFHARRLTNLGDLDGRVFALSPDGDRLLFTRTATETDYLNDLWLVRTTEASPNPVPLGAANLLWADWAPDGDAIAWTTAEVREQAPGWRGQNDLWRAAVTTRNTLVSRREVLEAEAGGGYGWWGTRYAWSPNGELLAYSRPESVGVVDITQGIADELLRFPAFRTFSSWSWNPDIAWSPDSSFLATGVHIPDSSENPEESPVFNLVQISVVDGYSATLAVEVGMWASPEFSPDGQSLLFGRAIVPYLSATSRYNLYLTDRDGSGQRQIYGPAEGGLELPAWLWGPDGSGVGFIAYGDVHWLELPSGNVEVITDEGGVTRLDWR